jgi:anaerobic magnesium-protoporphyrin IX monomethyl ester cyclase
MFRRREISHIITEIQMIKTLGYDHIWISDDCFTLDLTFLEKFCDELIQKNLSIKYCCLSRADKLEIGLLRKMRRSGCEKVYLGLESGNNHVLRLMNKNLTVEQSKKAVNLLKTAGIKIAGFFMVGYPGETWNTIDQTFNFALELELDEVSFNVPYPLPGSELFNRISEFDLKNDWTIENETNFVFKSDFDDELLNEKIKNFYEKYDKLKQKKISITLI